MIFSILQIEQKTQIIITSADETIKKAALSLGARSFKSKPITMERLIDNIKKALENFNGEK
ncbi:unnamed protein product [marine sediment metagenome]|uniref:Response regulatory domain-containing protein n=1 Tax=marine sediment metagenome TaxID=412755 RepID=X1G5M1_9ZZZZ